MRTSIALVWIVLVACEPPAPKHKPEKFVAHKHVADLTMVLPPGFTAHYNAITDSWRFVSSATTVMFERTPESSTASPDALRQVLDIDARIVDRQGIRDGFVAKFESGDVYVVRQIHNHDWFRCVSPVTNDDVLALCKSLKRPRRS
jgi:hypothetical protein